MVDVDKVVIAAERGHCHEDMPLAENIHANKSALHKLWYRVDCGQCEQSGDDDKGTLTATVDAAKVGMTYVKVAIDRECQSEPDAKRLSRRHYWIDVD